MSLEYDVLSGLIYEPKELGKVEIDADWFYDPTNREIARFLIDDRGQTTDPLVMFEEIRNQYPYTAATAEMLENMRIDGFGIGDGLEGKARQLKIRRYKDRFDEAARIYADYPSDGNLLKMKDSMRELDDMEKPEDDGSLDGTVQVLIEQLETEIEPGILSYPQLDDILGGGMFGGMLITIGARPGIGKTAYGLNVAMEAMQRQPNLVVDFFTLEMSKMQMLKRFISRMTEINSMKLRNPKLQLKEEEKTKVTANGYSLLQSELRVHDKLFHIKEIERQIRRRHYEAGDRPYIAFIDYLGLVDTSDKRQPRHVQVGEITRTLKILTNELNIPIVLFSQLNRAVEARQDKKPTLADLRESGSIEQDSNVVMFLHEDEEDDSITVVNVAKNREGFTGDIHYRFFKSKMYFEEVRQ